MIGKVASAVVIAAFVGQEIIVILVAIQEPIVEEARSL